MKSNRLLIFTSLLMSLFSATSCNNNNSLNVNRITDFVYETTINYDYSYEEVSDYFLKYMPKVGLCSSAIVGNKIGRNLDFFYTNGTQYILKISSTDKRYASIGVSNLVELFEDSAKDGQYHKEYKILPYATMDGINEAGIYCNINIVKYQNIGSWSMKTTDTSDDAVQIVAARIVLDNCAYLSDIPPIFDQIDFFPMGDEYETHLMVRGPRSKEDPTITNAIFEFIPFKISEDKSICKICCISNDEKDIAIVNNDASRFYKINADNLIMTNFNIWQFHPEYTNRKDRINSIIGNEMGLERYDILEESIKRIISEAGEKYKVSDIQMLDMMKRVNYSNFYDLYHNDFWYTELDVKPNKDELINLTDEQRNPNGDLEKVFRGENDRVYNNIKKEITNWKNRDRKTGKDFKLWETLYTCVYDYENKSLQIVPHEGSIAYERKLND